MLVRVPVAIPSRVVGIEIELAVPGRERRVHARPEGRGRGRRRGTRRECRVPDQPRELDGVALNDEHAGVTRAIEGAELEATRWLRDLAQPVDRALDLPAQSPSSTVERIDQCVADELGDQDDGQIASETVAMSTPAAAAARPRRVESLRQTLATKLRL